MWQHVGPLKNCILELGIMTWRHHLSLAYAFCTVTEIFISLFSFSGITWILRFYVVRTIGYFPWLMFLLHHLFFHHNCWWPRYSLCQLVNRLIFKNMWWTGYLHSGYRVSEIEAISSYPHGRWGHCLQRHYPSI